MSFFYRLLIPKNIRKALRNPFWLLLAVFLFSGWLRGECVNAWGASLVDRASQAVFELSAHLHAPKLVRRAAYCATYFGIVLMLTLFVVSTVGRLVIDFPAFTKAVFWAVTRSYEHNISRAEALILVAIPSAMSVAILADGVISLAACLLTALGIGFHNSSYNFSRLKRRTDDVMKMRAHTNFLIPPEIDDPAAIDER